MKTTLSRSVLLSLCVFGLALPQALHAQSLLLQYNFNETGTSATNGVVSGPSAALTNFGGTATDLHSAAGGGPSGLASDRAFDNTASAGMGSLSGVSGGGKATVTSGASVFGGLTQFTVTGWYNTATDPGSSAARLFTTNDGKEALFFSGATGLQLALSGATNSNVAAAINSSVYNATNTWIFFAVTYDGTTTSANVNFYAGGNILGTASSKAGTVTANAGTLSVTSTSITIANTTAGTRPFDGLMDDFRIYDGVLNASMVEAVRVSGLTASPVPEPATSTILASLAVLGCIAVQRRRKA